MKIFLHALLLIISGSPLLFYPFVLLANVMTLAGRDASPVPIHLKVVGYGFLLFSTLYPLPFFFSAYKIFTEEKKGKTKKAFLWQSVPFAYLGIMGLFFFGWWSIAGM